MVVFPNAKINIGLNILRKRTDNYHDIETLFFPVGICDQIEILESNQFCLTIKGINIEAAPEDNLVTKAYQLVKQHYNIPPVSISLDKNIPMGAGLGGGSSDAAFTILALDELFGLNIPQEEKMNLASKLGSDCSFFIVNKPAMAYGRGEILRECPIDLSYYSIVIVKPDVFVSTPKAYAGINPALPSVKLEELVKGPVSTWKNVIVNDFEKTVFARFPEIKDVKEKLYQAEADYAAMSGSGASVFGLFKAIPSDLEKQFPNCFVWVGK